MKTLLIILAIIITSYNSYAQNTFPSTGKVGIGTLTPLRNLSVMSPSNGVLAEHISTNPALNAYAILDILNDGGGENNGIAMLRVSNYAIKGSWSVGVDGINNNAFSISNSLDSKFTANKMVITTGGSVGIGTSKPDQKLTVNGNIHAKEVKVDLNIQAPDYVFDANYKLTGLNEIKAYVDKHHHLPEMPSADQMAKDGIQVGEMNMMLLKKVEELTLHLIEKENQIIQQQKKNQLQDARIEALESLLKLTNKGETRGNCNLKTPNPKP